MLPVPPTFLRAEPEIDQIAGHTRVVYSPSSPSHPVLHLEEFALNGQGYDFAPLSPQFERAEVAGDVPVRYQAHWRCDDLFVSANVYWTIEPEDASIESALAPLTQQLERACEAPQSVPTASVLLKDDRIPPTCTVQETDSVFDLYIENIGDESVLIRVWSDAKRMTTLEGVFAPGDRETIGVDVTKSNAGLVVRNLNDPDETAEISFGVLSSARDADVLVTNPRLDLVLSQGMCTS
jgi:hypothetical protein